MRQCDHLLVPSPSEDGTRGKCLPLQPWRFGHGGVILSEEGLETYSYLVSGRLRNPSLADSGLVVTSHSAVREDGEGCSWEEWRGILVMALLARRCFPVNMDSALEQA